ncbi:MAG: Ktr system potassium uptake protein B [Anaerolineae bacterium]|nr:Ktr system potassium uptake protein B [Anaerolineae bacterium]
MISYKQVRQHHLEHKKMPSPARGSKILVAGFAVIILIGTALLRLPVSTTGSYQVGWVEALFTATSATTVTGLVVLPTHATYTLFGQIVILSLIQVGGMGFIILSVVLFRLIGRRVSLYERNLLKETLGVEGRGGLVRLTLVVFISTIAVEMAGAAIMFTQYVQVLDWPTALYYSIFHAISAFCNAGFDLFTGFDDPALIFTRENPTILIVLSILITIGTLGITVVYDVVAWPREQRLSLHTKIVLPFTLLLSIVGTILLVFDEAYIDGQAIPFIFTGKNLVLAFFTVVSSRTAGLTLIPVDLLGEGSQLMLFVWMFIGGAPASMGGGVGLSTVAVVLITLQSTVLGYSDVRIFERTIPVETIIKAVAVLTVSTALVTGITLLVILLEPVNLFSIAFEVVSAFSNTGYSLGITAGLGTLSRLLIAFTMFWGRLGPLTLVVALAQRHRQTLIHYPEERIIIG